MLASLYLFFKTLHIIAIISWMAGLLYLYRLFVYHRSEESPVVLERFALMERKLWLIITVPAAWVAVLSGLSMVGIQGCALLAQGWFTLKLLAAVGLLLTHMGAGKLRKALLNEQRSLTEKRLRMLNEAPTLFMIIAVALVVYQPHWWLWTTC